MGSFTSRYLCYLGCTFFAVQHSQSVCICDIGTDGGQLAFLIPMGAHIELLAPIGSPSAAILLHRYIKEIYKNILCQVGQGYAREGDIRSRLHRQIHIDRCDHCVGKCTSLFRRYIHTCLLHTVFHQI